MAAEISNRQLLSIATEITAEGGSWAEFLDAENIPAVDVDDLFVRIDWAHFVRVMDAAARRWGLAHLENIAARSVSSEAVASFRDGITIQCDSLDDMMTYLFKADSGVFHSIVPCIKYSFEKVGSRKWRVDAVMAAGYELSPAQSHFGTGVLRALPPLLFENPAEITLRMAGDRAHYDFHVPGWRPMAFLRRRYARSLPNVGLAQRVGDTFTQLMIRQARLQAEAERRAEVEAELAQLDKLDALGQLTGSVAHDFNNLLTVVQGQLELLGMDLDDQKLIERVELAAKAADQGARLTRQLLAFGRRAALQPESTNANLIIEDMTPMFCSTLGKAVDVRTVLAGDLRHTMVDRGQLETALLNLAINARDAMPDGGALTIETTNVVIEEPDKQGAGEIGPGRYVLVAVSDTGEGISSNVLEHVFEPFFSTKERGMGNGLGLSMVWGFLQQSGGTARIASEIGEGTTVKLYFPEDETNPTITPVQGTVEAPHPVLAVPGSRVLVVEDEADVRDVVTDILRRLGYVVEPVESGESALAMLRHDHDFVLLLTDIVLPGGMSGPELAHEVQSIFPDLPVVYMSGYAEAQALNGEWLRPTDILLSKPFSATQLSQTLHEVLATPAVSSG